jgi:hypothetical protein
MDNLREKFPDLFYKEATLNPTNPRNRSTDWETDVVNQFRAAPESAVEFISTRETPSGTSLFFARPIRISNVSCLQCHSPPRPGSARDDQALRDGKWLWMEDG